MSYIQLEELFVYQTSRKLSDSAWILYESLDWKDKKIMGDQYITAVDSVGANIAEGYGRYHYLDRIKFYYNARASLIEAKHWSSLLFKREKILKKNYEEFIACAQHAHAQLNTYIRSVYESKK